MRQILLMFGLLTLQSLCGQTIEKVPYSNQYEFKEGVFLAIEQFKNNAPIPKSAIISTIPMTQIDFLTKVMEKKTVNYKDSSGKDQQVETSKVWGYYRNRSLYVNFNNDFNRVGLIGTLSLFPALVVKTATQVDPMYGVYGINTTYDELLQFILDTRTGKILEFNAENIELLLKEDAALYAEFMKLKKRTREDSIFIYLRKYNEKHPLYLPAN